MSKVTLHPITIDNWKECINLRVHESQERFLPSNLYSIAESQFYPDARPCSVYNDYRQMVGFVLYGKEIRTGKWKIFRLMIDRSCQRLGYGYATLRAVIAELATQPDCQEVLISYQRDNDPARQLYVSLGFVEQQGNDGHYTGIFYLTQEQSNRFT